MGTTAEKLQKIINTKKALQTSINNKGGAITDNTPFDQYPLAVDNLSTPIYWDGIYIEEELVSGYTLTLNVGSNVLNSSYYTYSLDSGTTWNQFTSSTMTLENVSTIKFRSTTSGSAYYLVIGTTSGGNDIYSGYESDNITITEDTTWYIDRQMAAQGGGGTDE